MPGAMPERAVILDGGMGHLLRRNGVLIQGEIGSMQRFLGVALANTEQPDLVMQSHLDYLDAGARIITTNTYSCVPSALEHAGSGLYDLTEKTGDDGAPVWDVIAKCIHAAGNLATGARAEFLKHTPDAEIKVAGCVPPLHESYRFDRVGSEEEMSAAYGQIVEIIKCYSDVLLCETLSCVRESSCAATAAALSGLPVWVAWTLHEDGSGNLRSSEPIEDAVAAVSHVKNLQACLVNCSSVESTMAAIPRLKEQLKKEGLEHVKIGAYANGFVTVNAATDGKDVDYGHAHCDHADKKRKCEETKDEKHEETATPSEYRVDLTPEKYLAEAEKWVQSGASIVGGCCGVFPEHIKALSSGL
jgi:S-methylmethionine-dependent homocysteine/selenocysteine methylase